MKDLLPILIAARKIGLNQSRQNIETIYGEIRDSCHGVEIDWDKDADESWARLIKNGQVIGIIGVRLPIAFIIPEPVITDSLAQRNFQIEHLHDFDSDQWKIDLNDLRQAIPEIEWHASEDAINTDQFSIFDFWYATV